MAYETENWDMCIHQDRLVYWRILTILSHFVGNGKLSIVILDIQVFRLQYLSQMGHFLVKICLFRLKDGNVRIS